jgi:ATP-dependent exoDNAse (exonuclease V) beta subunit
MNEELKPGLFQGIAFDDYALWPAANFSVLSKFRRTAMHARHYMLSGSESSERMRAGWLAHIAILEPKAFERDFVAAPKLDKRTKVGKSAWSEFVAAHKDQEALTEEEFSRCVRIGRAVHEHPAAAEILEGPGINEASLLWRDEETGVPCKGRLDRLVSYRGRPVIVDVKTTTSAARRDWERSVASLAYHEQAAHYLDGASALAPLDRLFLWIVVEQEEPHGVAVYEIEEAALSQGRDDCHKHLRQYRECLETGLWPGYAPGIDYAGIPAWAYRSLDAD